jgi:hypothetical protein
MITRKKFIKLSGFAALAAGSGFAVGKLIDKPVNHKFSIYGFLPLDKQLISEVVNTFHKNVRSNSEATIIANKEQENLLKNILNNRKHNSFSNSGSIQYKIEKLNNPVYSDIVVSDNLRPVYSLKNDFSKEMVKLRDQLSDIKAQIFFSAEYKQTDIFSSLFSRQRKEIVIENEKGLFDRIPANSNYKTIMVSGPQGKTEIEVNNGIAKVIRSTCRHKLCEKVRFAANNGDVIACAPNKVLIRVEQV